MNNVKVIDDKGEVFYIKIRPVRNLWSLYFHKKFNGFYYRTLKEFGNMGPTRAGGRYKKGKAKKACLLRGFR